jgi:hypothetical protein
VLPSTAFAGAQQPPDDEAVTGFFCDNSVSAAAPTVPPDWAAKAIDPPVMVATAVTAHAIAAKPFLRTLIPILHILQTFSQVYTDLLTQFIAEGQTSIRVGGLADRSAPLHVVIAPFIDSRRDSGTPSWGKIYASRQT